MMICENRKCKTVIVLRNSVVILLFWLTSCQQPQEEILQEVMDLPQIREKQTLVVATNYNPADYFISKGEPMGFQYEILTELGKHLDVKIEILVGKSFSQNQQYLSEGRCDIIASDLTPDDTLSEALYQSQQVLVQRKPARWRKISGQEIEKYMVREPQALNGKMVYTSGWSPLSNGEDFEADRHIRFVKIKGIEPEALMGLVAEGELDYAICNRSTARLIAGRYDNLDIQTTLGELSVGWIMRPTSAALQEEVTRWLSGFKKTAKYAVLYKKYHRNQPNATNRYFASTTGKISDYDQIFRKYSKEIGWDWRLLASLVCQESRFQPQVRSKKGAYGLMQMMPATLEHFGVDSTASPEQHIKAGVAYIKYLYKIITPNVQDDDERIKFVLASYNIGPGHILDAQRLAEKYGKNAGQWDDNVGIYLLNKSEPQYYNDPEVRHGKCKGRETQAFVSQILNRYEHYKNIVKI